MKHAIIAVAMTFAACAVQAQLIFRCGPDDYSHTPCPGGTIVESSDPRSAAQRDEALRVAAQERRRAAALERERRAQQATTPPALATGFNGRPPPPEAAASSADRGKPRKGSAKAKPGMSPDFVAVEPGAKKKRKATKSE